MSLAHYHARIKLHLLRREQDPLDYWQWGVERLKEAFALFAQRGPGKHGPIEELHLRACNKGGKTVSLAAYVISCLQKRLTLDGVPIPQWRGRIEGAQLVRDYTQQVLSVQPAYLKVLGKWPHKLRFKGEILSSILVKPINGTEEEETWSVLHFLSQENRRSGLGVRADIVAFDEPPRIEILRELRKAAHAGRKLCIIIAETPTIRSHWADLKLDYGDCPRSALRRVDQDRAECRWSLHEVADSILSPDDKDKLRRRYRTDPLREAREHGDYIDASGACPFGIETLMRMLEECTDPQIVKWEVHREINSDEGRVKKLVKVEVHVWKHAEIGKAYYIPIDPSSGVKDPLHDPGALHVREVGSGDLVAMFNGYIGSFGLGVLAAGLARQYNNAIVDPETTGGWGEGVLSGLREAHYGNLTKSKRLLQPGQPEMVEFGFKTTHESRGAMIAAVQAWVDAWGEGIKYAKCPSRDVIQTLLDTILDEDGKAVAAPGFHDEHLILWGQGNRRAVSRMGRVMPEANPPKRTGEQNLIARIRGEQREEYEAPFGQVAHRYKVGPRI